jgi:hypothetical protein
MPNLKLVSTNRGVAERIQGMSARFLHQLLLLGVKEQAQSMRKRIKFKIKFDPSDKKSQKSKKSMLTFEDGDVEMWCKRQEQL